jgi:long-subunit fatty acid transport protein
MKKVSLLLFGIILSSSFVFAGGLVHNTNQSAAWSRMLSRGATLDIDAVYFNPAGLTKLGDGFHISISSQSIFQTQTITSTFPFLNEQKYTGKISAPVFPSVYLSYNTGKFAFSFGFLPLGGGGGAKFDKGVPMMEVPIASLVPAFADRGVTGYSVDMEFQGTSVYWGLQAGVSYEINDNFSVFAGARYLMARNTYKGYIRDIRLLTADGTNPRADDFMNGMGQSMATVASDMTPLVELMGGATFDEAIAATAGDPATQAKIIGLKAGIEQLGVPNAGALTIAQGQGVFTATSQQLIGGASLMGDQEGDIVQTGSGITPIIGANLSFMENDLNIGLKYEFKTKMDLTNDVKDNKGFVIGMNPDGTPEYMFPDGAKTNADVPAMLSVGVDYKVIDPLKVSVTYHSYFDKGTEWEEEADPKQIDDNFWELAVGLEYNINENFLVSGGYLHAHTGVNQNYQSNLGFSLTSNTFAVGGAYKINDMFRLNLGGYITTYDEQKYPMSYEVMGSGTMIDYTESYLKETFAVAVGVDITIGSKK